jgi:ribosome maturation factor RimP
VTVASQVRAIVEPLLVGTPVELVDVEHTGGVLRVTIDRPGGVDLALITDVNRRVSRALDEADPLPGRYTLEVSSPGLERPLRTPEHFRRAVGATVRLKTHPEVPGDRRIQGSLVAADEDTVTVVPTGEPDLEVDAAPPGRTIAYEDIESARTVFEWGPAARPNPPQHRRTKKSKTKTKKAATP